MKKFVIDYVPEMLNEPLVNYTVIGWTDLDKMADLSIEDLDEKTAEDLFNKLVDSFKYECVMVRKEKVWLRRDDAECSTSTGWLEWSIKSGLYLVDGKKRRRVV
jgi:hypothetical protein